MNYCIPALGQSSPSEEKTYTIQGSSKPCTVAAHSVCWQVTAGLLPVLLLVDTYTLTHTHTHTLTHTHTYTHTHSHTHALTHTLTHTHTHSLTHTHTHTHTL